MRTRTSCGASSRAGSRRSASASTSPSPRSRRRFEAPSVEPRHASAPSCRWKSTRHATGWPTSNVVAGASSGGTAPRDAHRPRGVPALRVPDQTSSHLGLEAQAAGRRPRQADLRLRASARSAARAHRIRARTKPHHRQVALRVGGALLPLRADASEHNPAPAPVHVVQRLFVGDDDFVDGSGDAARSAKRPAHPHSVHHAGRLRARPQRQARGRSRAGHQLRGHD